jgi:hypothetical protein
MPSTSLSVADAFRATLDLFDTGLNLMRQNLRRSHPEADDKEIERLLRDWLLGARPSNRFSRKPVSKTVDKSRVAIVKTADSWHYSDTLLDRPGAESGDCLRRPVDRLA